MLGPRPGVGPNYVNLLDRANRRGWPFPAQPAKTSPVMATIVIVIHLIEMCIRDRARADARVRVVDFLIDNSIARDPNNFWDGLHYRGAIAVQIEDAIAKAAGR